MVPGRHPFDELDAARRGVPEDADLVLVIDQFEELFSMTDPDDRRAFLRALVDMTSASASRTRIVLTLRADFYDRPLLDPDFGPVFSRHVVNAHAMTAAEIEAAVIQPSRRVGVDVDPALLAELVADTVAQPGALPLLQHALTELFDHRADASLTLEAYRGLGGLHGLLSRSSEEVYRSMDPDHERVALQVFLRLVRLGAGTQETRRRVPVAELAALDIDPVILSEVLEAFGTHRLLTFDRDPVTGDSTVEVAHEALLSGWDRLARWIDRHRADLRRHAALTAAVDEWEVSGRDPGYLLTRARLTETETWAADTALALTATEREFIDVSAGRRTAEEADAASRRQHERRLERRSRVRLAGLAAAVVVLAGTIAYGVVAWPDNPPLDAALLGGGPPVFRDMLVDGFGTAVDQLDVRAETVEPDGFDASAEQLDEYSDNGTRLIVALSQTCDTTISPIARDHPETAYAVFDCVGEMPPNVASVTFAAEQASFLAGAAAALKSETGVVGFIGALEVPPIWEFHAGFEAGAQAVDPNIEVRSAYLQPPSYNPFEDPISAFQVAEQMYRAGVDVIFPAAGGSITGVAEAAARLSEPLGRHLWMIGVDDDYFAVISQGDPADPWLPHILTSTEKRYDRAVFALLEEQAAGELTLGTRHFDLATGAVGLADSGGFIDDIRPQLEDLAERVISGEIYVPKVPANSVDEAAELGLSP
jgi:basic membrane lipoprotein Med (substrate-binding protein (PBP1-ABC) superfamily)